MSILAIFSGIGVVLSLVALIIPFAPFYTRGRAFLGSILFTAISILLGSLSHESKTTGKGSSNQVSKANAGQDAVAQPPAPVSASSWKSSDDTDEMTGATTQWMCTVSKNSLDFSFPYNGGATGELCIRKENKSLDVYVTINPGQFMCGFEDCVVKLKFDDSPVATFTAIEANDGRSNTLFIRSEQRVLAKLKKSKRLKLQARYFQEGDRVLDFDTDGLVWK